MRVWDPLDPKNLSICVWVQWTPVGSLRVNRKKVKGLLLGRDVLFLLSLYMVVIFELDNTWDMR